MNDWKMVVGRGSDATSAVTFSGFDSALHIQFIYRLGNLTPSFITYAIVVSNLSFLDMVLMINFNKR